MAYNQIYSNYTPRKQSFGPVPLAGGNSGGGGWQPGGLNTGGSAFTLGQADNQQPQGSAVNLVGGGTATPENYLGDWVPEPRRKMLSQIGFGNGAGSELLSLRKQYNAEKNNYAKQDIMSKIVNAETRFNRELQGQEQEYRSLARAANYAGAQKMVNEETAAGRGEGLAARAGNAILSNNHFSHGAINQGRMVAPAGNAVEDALKAYKLTGRTPSLDLLQMLAVSDALSQDDYMPSGPFGLNKSLGSYKSMSDVGQAGGMKVFGYDDAFGGSGKQAAIQDSFDILRDNKWQNDAKNSYIKSISNTHPVGDYKGPSQEYLANVKGWNKFPKNYAGPGANSEYTGNSGYPGEGYALSNAGYVPTNATDGGVDGEDSNGWISGESTGSRNPPRFDPTVPSKEYTPKLGNLTGWNQERMSKPYLQQDDKYPMQRGDFTGNPRPSLQRGFQGSPLDLLKGIAGAATAPLAGAANSWKPGRTAYDVPLPRELQNPFADTKNISLPALPAAFGIAEAPPLKKVEAKNLASPKGDIFDQQLFGTQSYGSPDVRNYEKDNAPAVRGDNAFRHAPVGPVEAGQIDAAMSGPWLSRSQDPRHRAVVNGFKQLKIKNPPMAQFLARAYM